MQRFAVEEERVVHGRFMPCRAPRACASGGASGGVFEQEKGQARPAASIRRSRLASAARRSRPSPCDGDAAGFEEQGRGERGDAGQADEVDAAADAGEHLLDPGEVDQAAHRLFAGDLQEQVVGVVFAQRVVEDVGGEGGLPPGLAAALVRAFDQARDDGGVAEGALHHGVAGEPGLEAVAQGCEVEEGGGVGDRVEAPDQGGVVGGDEAEGGKALRSSICLVTSRPRVCWALRPAKP